VASQLRGDQTHEVWSEVGTRSEDMDPGEQGRGSQRVKSVRCEVQVYTNRSGIGSGIGAAVVLFRNGEEKHTLRKYLGKECEHMVFEVEVMGLALVASWLGRDTHGHGGDWD